MEVLGIIGIIILCIILFVLFGLLGWGLKIFGWIIEFLGEGCSTSFGCLIWIMAIIIALMAVL